MWGAWRGGEYTGEKITNNGITALSWLLVYELSCNFNNADDDQDGEDGVFGGGNSAQSASHDETLSVDQSEATPVTCPVSPGCPPPVSPPESQ